MSYVLPPNYVPFILKHATDTLKEAVSSLNATNGGIETYPVCSYVMHSLFLKLTGAQEQKLKCICWELACRNYEYRYDRFERERYSECSNYKDKNMIYNDLLDAIREYDSSFVVNNALKDQILADWRLAMGEILDGSILAKGFRKSYLEYKTVISSIDNRWIMDTMQLLTNKASLPAAARVNTCGLGLLELFKNYVYKERNRCAHNTRSYQHNIPSLKSMTMPEHKLQNYFLFIAVMVLLDEIYVKLFEIYLGKYK